MMLLVIHFIFIVFYILVQKVIQPSHQPVTPNDIYAQCQNKQNALHWITPMKNGLKSDLKTAMYISMAP